MFSVYTCTWCGGQPYDVEYCICGWEDNQHQSTCRFSVDVGHYLDSKVARVIRGASHRISGCSCDDLLAQVAPLVREGCSQRDAVRILEDRDTV